MTKAFRLIVLRRAVQADLFEETAGYKYHAIASNRSGEDAAATMTWYSQRGDTSENRIKELKIGFGMEYMPCGTFAANAVFFAIGVLAYNLYLGFRAHTLGMEWRSAQVQTIRWSLFQAAGRIVRHGRQMFLKINAALLATFTAIRRRCMRFARQAAVLSNTV